MKENMTIIRSSMNSYFQNIENSGPLRKNIRDIINFQTCIIFLICPGILWIPAVAPFADDLNIRTFKWNSKRKLSQDFRSETLWNLTIVPGEFRAQNFLIFAKRDICARVGKITN